MGFHTNGQKHNKTASDVHSCLQFPPAIPKSILKSVDNRSNLNSKCNHDLIQKTKNCPALTFISVLKEERNPSWWLIMLSISSQNQFEALGKTQKAVFLSPLLLSSLSEGHLAVLFESDGGQLETKDRMEAWIYHDWGFRTGRPATKEPAPAGPELQAAADQSLRQVLHALHGQLQQQHRVRVGLQAQPGVCRALPGPAVLLQVCRRGKMVAWMWTHNGGSFLYIYWTLCTSSAATWYQVNKQDLNLICCLCVSKVWIALS